MKHKAIKSPRPVHLVGVSLALGILTAGPVQAAVVTLNMINSYNQTGAFGLAFDGANLWYNSNTGIHEMTTAGVDTGNTTPWVGGVSSLSALAWTGTQLAAGRDVPGPTGTVVLFDRFTGGNLSLLTLHGGAADHSPFDGLDFDSGEWWYSPDAGAVYRDDAGGNLVGPNPFAAGAYSGVERVFDHVLAVSFGTDPRSLCVYGLDQAFVGCGSLGGLPGATHYEDLAFDGRYLWAADYYGKINEYDVLVDGESILVPRAVPEPTTLALLGAGLVAVRARRRRTS